MTDLWTCQENFGSIRKEISIVLLMSDNLFYLTMYYLYLPGKSYFCYVKFFFWLIKCQTKISSFWEKLSYQLKRKKHMKKQLKNSKSWVISSMLKYEKPFTMSTVTVQRWWNTIIVVWKTISIVVKTWLCSEGSCLGTFIEKYHKTLKMKHKNLRVVHAWRYLWFFVFEVLITVP